MIDVLITLRARQTVSLYPQHQKYVLGATRFISTPPEPTCFANHLLRVTEFIENKGQRSHPLHARVDQNIDEDWEKIVCAQLTRFVSWVLSAIQRWNSVSHRHKCIELCPGPGGKKRIKDGRTRGDGGREIY